MGVLFSAQMCLNLQSTSDDDDSNYDEVDADDITAESPVLDFEMANQEQEQTLAIMPEEFPELEQEKDVEAELNDKKVREHILRPTLHVSWSGIDLSGIDLSGVEWTLIFSEVSRGCSVLFGNVQLH